ncbi:cadherin repeat domain-containing protein [Ulvibacter litoralis]|uniref:Cadherin domain-containing protein n=1 Tax=Ulvibacter litoralis TaxID=227084 RepID=A0A1G7EK31_9FLAO|nr:cadherin repeat domain-containing protein [Ulvibacter litoralis]SDE63994.1 hypothetical protein SAMN05421855_10213 [Ulvibacter litoralis]
MKIFNATPLFQFVLLCATFAVVSCSKDSEDTPLIPEVTDLLTTSNFVASIVENPEQNQVIGAVSGATTQGTLSYTITSESSPGALAINSASGELTVADPAAFDFEINTTITGIVAVTNGTISQNAIITISIEDVNEDKIFEGTVILETQQEIDDFGANNYTHITGSLQIGSIDDATTFNDITPLSSIRSIGNRLTIFRNIELTSLAGLENIETVINTIYIIQNDKLADISALSNVTEIRLDLYVWLNPLLSNLNGLHNITSVGSLSIAENSALTDLDDLHISTANNSVIISDNDLLTNIDSLNSISSINGHIEISYNASLTNIDGLSNLNFLLYHLQINNNINLTNLCGIQNLIVNGGLSNEYIVHSNAYNPTQQDIIDGNCSI